MLAGMGLPGIPAPPFKIPSGRDAATMEERVHAAVALGHLATENPENQAPEWPVS